VTIASPDEGDDVSGALAVSGSVTDANLHSYMVEYKSAAASTWTEVQPEQRTAGVDGVLATWLTAGLSGGDYTLRVTAEDAVGEAATDEVTVTLKGAKLSISGSDIAFSDSHPLPDDTVKVMVTVRNTGDSPAEDVTVTVYDGGKAVGEESGITVPAHGTYTVEVETKAEEGGSTFTARATSPLYDTGDMDAGQPLNTIEPESVLENSAGVIGLLALLIAIFCLVTILLGKAGGKEEPPAEPDDDVVVVDPIVEMETLEPEPEAIPVEEPMGERPRTH
jgi:hypothetical protein